MKVLSFVRKRGNEYWQSGIGKIQKEESSCQDAYLTGSKGVKTIVLTGFYTSKKYPDNLKRINLINS